VGETRVDLLHLLEDLRDAYPGSVEETILTEIVANALDSGATTIDLLTNRTQATLTVLDDGSGMQRRDLARYHDLAATTKMRGRGIGFAGVGIKLGLLVSSEVFTETRRGKTHAATAWRLASRHRAPWKWSPPQGLVRERGTAVRLTLQNPLSPLLDAGFLEGTLQRQFTSLLDPTFDSFLTRPYPGGVRFLVDGSPLLKLTVSGTDRAPIEVRLARKRKPSAIGYLVRFDAPAAEELQGIGIATYGKVIKRGWDWLGLTPRLGDCIAGLIEAPDLAASLTLNKGDFIRVGVRGAAYLSYRKAIQEVVSRQLAAWGNDSDGRAEPARKIGGVREIERIIEDLSEDFPLLSSLVERRRGGQKLLPMAARGKGHAPELAMIDGASAGETTEGNAEAPQPSGASAARPTEPQPPSVAEAPGSVELPAAKTVRRPARYGLSIQFDERPEDPELARLVESTIWVNQAHPAFRRADASRLIGYHIALAVALALAPLAVEPKDEHGFVTAFLSRWGRASERKQRRRRA
jgi:hypothetical protein